MQGCDRLLWLYCDVQRGGTVLEGCAALGEICLILSSYKLICTDQILHLYVHCSVVALFCTLQCLTMVRHFAHDYPFEICVFHTVFITLLIAFHKLILCDNSILCHQRTPFSTSYRIEGQYGDHSYPQQRKTLPTCCHPSIVHGDQDDSASIF